MTRREWLRRSIGAAGGASFLGLLDPNILFAAGDHPGRTADAVIVLWMGGGMSHIDTFDPQPGADHGGPFQAIKTGIEGISISEHLPRIAAQLERLSIIRSTTSNEFDHSRATYELHTGYPPIASIQHSTIGSVISKYKGRNPKDDCLPPYISIGIDWAAGYLGPKYAPYYIGRAADADSNLAPPSGIGQKRFNARLKLMRSLDRSFAARHRSAEVLSEYAEHYSAALQMMRPGTAKVFDLDAEPQPLREAYGADSSFGQGCLLARRLVQAGVRFVEVTFGGWDTHQNNFDVVKDKSIELDIAFGTLIQDLKAKGLLEKTVVVLTSEFGRTPAINGNQGRDHHPRVWSTLIGGGGLKSGIAIGESDQGKDVRTRPIRVGDLHATLCVALGIDPEQTNYSSDRRPFRIIKDESAGPINELFEGS